MSFSLDYIVEIINQFVLGNFGYLIFISALIIVVTIVTSIIYIFKKIINKKIERYFSFKSFHSNKELLFYLDKNEMVQGMLEKISLRTNANSVFLMQFHNGSNSMIGIPFIFQSCTHWYSRDKNLHTFKRMQNLLISLFPKFLKELVSKENIYINDIQEWDENSMRQFLDECGYKTLIFLTLDDEYNNKVGYVTICFREEVTLQPDQDYYIHQMKNNIKFELRKIEQHICKRKKNV